MRTRGPRLGEVLEQRGWVSREHLLRALRNQKVVGGRLGTCLLEIDAVSEDDLLKALSEQQGVPPVSPDDLRHVPAEVIRLVPAKVARRLLAVPFRASGSSAHIAVFEARDLAALDELAFVSGRRVRVCVATEVRLVEALEKHYGEEAPPRMAKLLDRLNRTRYLWTGEGAPPSSRKSSEMLQWDPSLSGAAPARGVPRESESQGFPIFEPSAAPRLPDIALPAAPQAAGASAAPALAAPAARAAALPATPAPPTAPERAPEPPPAAPSAAEAAPPAPAAVAAAPPPDTISLESAEQRLLSPADRDDVARVLLEFGASRSRRVLLFRIHRQEVAGWMAAGAGVDLAAVAGYRGALDRPSVFFTLHSGAPIFRGALPDLPAHEAIRAALEGGPAADALALPVVVKDRVVAVLYAEPPGTSFEPAAVADLQRLVAKAAIAFELCIMRAKLKRA